MPTIFATIWQDFGLPLSLQTETAEEAIAKAKRIADRMRANHLPILAGTVAAVALAPDDSLTRLWP